MPAYRYLLCDLLTDQLLADLPLTGVSFERRISRVGSLSATLSASRVVRHLGREVYETDPHLITKARLLRDYAGRSALYVLRDGQPWWGGIPWTVTASQGQRGPVQVSIQAATFDSYPHHRVLRDTLEFTQVDQGVIIPALWRHLQADPRGNIGVEAEDQPTGVLRDRTYLGHELAYYGARIEELGDVQGGPEHTIDVYLDGDGNRVKRLRVADRLGQSRARVVFQRAIREGGRVLEWADTTDAVDTGTTFQARGGAPSTAAGGDAPPLLSDVVEATDLLDRGWPLLDVVQDRADVSRKSTLDDWAQTDAAQLAGAERTESYTVQVGATGWSPNRIGDAVRIKLSDDWHGSSDVVVRPVACKVNAPERGAPETVELTFGGDDE